MDQIARHAHVGNTTLYRRYQDKESLFTAVIERLVEDAIARMAIDVDGATAGDRLRRTGIRIGEISLVDDVIAIMRMSAAEAESFPDVARIGYQIGFDAAVRQAARAIAASDDALALDVAMPVATRFIELSLHPLALQAMFGIGLDLLQPRIAQSVDDAIMVLHASGLLIADPGG